jgi:hypothetical protein
MIVEYKHGSDIYVEQSALLTLLNLESQEKNLLTRSVTSIFPDSVKKRIMVDGQTKYP